MSDVQPLLQSSQGWTKGAPATSPPCVPHALHAAATARRHRGHMTYQPLPQGSAAGSGGDQRPGLDALGWHPAHAGALAPASAFATCADVARMPILREDSPPPEPPTGTTSLLASIAAYAGRHRLLRQVRLQQELQTERIRARQQQGWHKGLQAIGSGMRHASARLRQRLIKLRGRGTSAEQLYGLQDEERDAGGRADWGEALATMQQRLRLLGRIKRQERLVAAKRAQLKKLSSASSRWRFLQAARALRSHKLGKSASRGRRALSLLDTQSPRRFLQRADSSLVVLQQRSHMPLPVAGGRTGSTGSEASSRRPVEYTQTAADVLHAACLGLEADLAALQEQLRQLDQDKLEGWNGGPRSEASLCRHERQQAQAQLAAERATVRRLKARLLLARLPGLGHMAELPGSDAGTPDSAVGTAPTRSAAEALRTAEDNIRAHTQLLLDRKNVAARAREMAPAGGPAATAAMAASACGDNAAAGACGGSATASRHTSYSSTIRRRLLVGEAELHGHQQRQLAVMTGAQAVAAALAAKQGDRPGRRVSKGSARASRRHSGSAGGAAPDTDEPARGAGADAFASGGLDSEAAAELAASFPQQLQSASGPERRVPVLARNSSSSSGRQPRPATMLLAQQAQMAACPQRREHWQVDAQAQDAGEVGEEGLRYAYDTLQRHGILAATLPLHQAAHEAALARQLVGTDVNAAGVPELAAGSGGASLSGQVPPWLLKYEHRITRGGGAARALLRRAAAPASAQLQGTPAERRALVEDFGVSSALPAWRDATALRRLTLQEVLVARACVVEPAQGLWQEDLLCGGSCRRHTTHA